MMKNPLILSGLTKDHRSTAKKRHFSLRPIFSLLILMAGSLLLCGCAGKGLNASAGDTSLMEIPEANEDGAVSIGGLVEAPASIDGFTLTEYNEALTASGYYYAAWTTGDAVPYTNSDGEEAELYPAQIYMIAYEGTDEADAASRAAAWLAAADQQYEVGEKTETDSGTILSYSIPASSNPYCSGASAFSSAGTCAYCVEVLRTEDWSGDPGSVLSDFLQALSLQGSP